jgi:uncharacterized protein YktB (UPF0637 family)
MTENTESRNKLLISQLEKGQRRFNGFSDDALRLQEYLHEQKWEKKSWDETSREIWAEDIRPQLNAILTDCSEALQEFSGECFESQLARPVPHGNVAKWFWGAVVKEGKTVHNDIQLFVALRWGYVRVGLYVNNQDEDNFKRVMSNITNKEKDIEDALRIAKENQVFLCITADISDGRIIEFELTENTWRNEFLKRKEIGLAKAWEIDDDILQNPEFAEEVLKTFSSLLPLYYILNDTR